MKQRIKNKIRKSYNVWATIVMKYFNGEELTKKERKADLPYNGEQIDRAFNHKLKKNGRNNSSI